MKKASKIFLMFCTLLPLCVILIGCTAAPVAKGTYIIDRVTLIQHTKIVYNFDVHRNGSYEIRLESGIATASYIYFTDDGNNKIYQTYSGSAVTDWKQKGKKVILEGTLGVGTIDLEVQEGWLILTHSIEGEPIYVAYYKKST